jgi:hypothetical protein
VIVTTLPSALFALAGCAGVSLAVALLIGAAIKRGSGDQ